jgi:hypothetical protein
MTVESETVIALSPFRRRSSTIRNGGMKMKTITKKHRLGFAGAAAVALVGLGALALPTASADAQVYFGMGPGGFSVGLGAPATPYYSPYYSPYYPAPYYPPYAPAPYYYGW